MSYSLFLLTYKWLNGGARLKTTNNLETSPYKVVVETSTGEENKVYPSHIKIPQPKRFNLPIWTQELEYAVNMLGVYHSLDASKSSQVKEMTKKGIDWANRMKTGKFPRRDAWMRIFSLSCYQEQSGDSWQWL